MKWGCIGELIKLLLDEHNNEEKSAVNSSLFFHHLFFLATRTDMKTKSKKYRAMKC
jgi:hypothetical protein